MKGDYKEVFDKLNSKLKEELAEANA